MLSEKVVNNLKKASFIRTMFEEGEKLRQKYGPENVFDFSLGNPDPEPPVDVKKALLRLIEEDRPGLHGYMPNAGYADVRQKVAEALSVEHGVKLGYENVIMTAGAGGALNVVFKSILNPGEEVIVLSPYFVEYLFYIDNHGGKSVIVPVNRDTFEPDPELIESRITPATKALLINSPNNPTGVVYSEKVLMELADVIKKKEKEYGTTIFVVSDEPYRKLVYDGVKVPSILKIFENSIVVDSYSKSLSLPGERIGYIAVSPSARDAALLADALIFSNRTLGFVNAPSLFQRVIGETAYLSVDPAIYKERRDLLYNKLTELGFSCIKPSGAFYLFPRSPLEDDVEFVRAAMKYNLILVPGSGFGCPGYFRIAYCKDVKVIENSFAAFEALAREFIG